LKRRGFVNLRSQDETIYLEPLEHLVKTGRTAADDLLDRYNGPWNKNINHIFAEYAF
jgi:glutamate--cysteine ligase